MPSIRVKGLDRVIEVESGADLLKACKTNHVNLFWGPWAKALNCRGKGFCNLCKVQVLEGKDGLAPKTKRETKRLQGRPDDWRLACCAKVTGDIEIDTFPVRHARDRVQAEALHRATLDEERLKEVEAADWEALRETEKPKEKKPKKGLLAKVRKQKGIDDSDERAPGAPLADTEAPSGAQEKGKKLRLGKGAGKNKASEKAAEPPAEAPIGSAGASDEKPTKRRFGKK